MKTLYVIDEVKQAFLDRLLGNGVKMVEISKLIGVPYHVLRDKLKQRRDGNENWHCRKTVTARERWEKATKADYERDEIRCRCYREVQLSNGGITGEDVARLTGFALADVERELLDMSRVRCGCRLVYCEAGRWKACEFNNWNGGPADDHIRRYRMTDIGIVEAA